jgi:hypothetical protein
MCAVLFNSPHSVIVASKYERFGALSKPLWHASFRYHAPKPYSLPNAARLPRRTVLKHHRPFPKSFEAKPKRNPFTWCISCIGRTPVWRLDMVRSPTRVVPSTNRTRSSIRTYPCPYSSPNDARLGAAHVAPALGFGYAIFVTLAFRLTLLGLFVANAIAAGL